MLAEDNTNTVSDILAITKVLRKYANEPLIKSILKEALENKNGEGSPILHQQTRVTIPEPTENDQEYSR